MDTAQRGVDTAQMMVDSAQTDVDAALMRVITAQKGVDAAKADLAASLAADSGLPCLSHRRTSENVLIFIHRWILEAGFLFMVCSWILYYLAAAGKAIPEDEDCLRCNFRTFEKPRAIVLSRSILSVYLRNHGIRDIRARSGIRLFVLAQGPLCWW